MSVLWMAVCLTWGEWIAFSLVRAQVRYRRAVREIGKT